MSLAEWNYTVSKSTSGQNDKFISWQFDDCMVAINELGDMFLCADTQFYANTAFV